MKQHSTNGFQVVVTPETTQEAGLMHWLAERFQGRLVRLDFNTTNHPVSDTYPALWITEVLKAPPTQAPGEKGSGT